MTRIVSLREQFPACRTCGNRIAPEYWQRPAELRRLLLRLKPDEIECVECDAKACVKQWEAQDPELFAYLEGKRGPDDAA